MKQIPLAKTAIILSITIFTAVALVYTAREKKNLLRLKKEIREELSRDMADIVKQEIKAYLDDSSKQESAGHLVLKDKNLEKNKDGLQGEVRELVKKELDAYVASGIENELSISRGLKKHNNDTFAKNDVSNASNEIKAQSNTTQPSPKSAEELEETTAGKQRSLERTLVEKGGMLLRKGQLQIESSFTAANFSSNKVNLDGFNILEVFTIGEISVESVKRDILIETLSLKYGLLNNLQADVKIPYRFEHDRITTTPVGNSVTRERTREAGGWGDIDFALSRQIGYEKGIIPDTIAMLSVKTDTGRSPYNREIGLGTGHWAVKGALIAAKSSDPAVIFGSLNYIWNIERKIDNFGKVDPGDTIGYSLGAAIALSYQTAINFQFEQSITEKMKINGRHVRGSFINAASLKAGFTWSFSEKAAIDFSVSTGLTTDAPDYVIELRFPYTF